MPNQGSKNPRVYSGSINPKLRARLLRAWRRKQAIEYFTNANFVNFRRCGKSGLQARLFCYHLRWL